MEHVELRTGHLLLRPWRPDDADAVYEVCQDPEIQRWTRVPSPYTKEDARSFVEDISPKAWADGSGAPFGVFDPGSGELLASAGINRFNRVDGTAEIGFWAAPSARGRGVVTAATLAIAQWCFAEQDVGRVEWEAMVGNHSSLRVAQKAGFAYEGIRRGGLVQRGARLDAWLGALLAENHQPTSLPDPGELTDGDLTLRPWRPADAPEIPRIIDDEVTRWMAMMPQPYDDAAAVMWTTNLSPVQWFAGLGGGVALREAGQLAGGLGFTLDKDGAAEMGLWVGVGARGRGLGPRAAKVLGDWMFAHLDVARIEWRAHPENAPSRAAAVKAGFVEEGLRRACDRGRDGVPEDRVVYVRLR
jgi:RimJ/RimL family protein N-acetyltransferase